MLTVLIIAKTSRHFGCSQYGTRILFDSQGLTILRRSNSVEPYEVIESVLYNHRGEYIYIGLYNDTRTFLKVVETYIIYMHTLHHLFFIFNYDILL